VNDAVIAERIQAEVLARMEADDLILPTMPLVVSKCLTLLDDPDLSLREVAQVIETDPLIAAQIVRLANVASRAPTSPIRSITDCVTRLGVSELQLFLIESAARRMFESSDKQIAQICRALWGHSLAVAILTRDLVREARNARADEGYLAGLLHDIGKPVVASLLLDAERRLRGTRTQSWIMPAAWLRILSGSHRKVGAQQHPRRGQLRPGRAALAGQRRAPGQRDQQDRGGVRRRHGRERDRVDRGDRARAVRHRRRAVEVPDDLPQGARERAPGLRRAPRPCRAATRSPR
jgi:hypothetical protein